MAFQFEHDNASAYPLPTGHPYRYDEQGLFSGNSEPAPDGFESAEDETSVEPINLVNINGAKVVQALINGAVQCIEAEAGEDVEVPAPMSLKQARALLDGLRKQFPSKADQAELVLDDLRLEGVPSLPGFRPFARVISVEAIEALDHRYGDGFVNDNLAELIEQRDRKALGRTAVEAAVEAQDETMREGELDPLSDNPENEFAFRWRDGQLYVGDIPFHIWYGYLHAAAATFIQQLRREGRDDLPDVKPIDPDDLREKAAEAKAEGRPLVMSTRTGLPILTSRHTDLDIREINQTFHEQGYDQSRNFVYDALLPVLGVAPRRLGPLRTRRPVPAPRVPQGLDYWIAMVQETGAMSRTEGGLEQQHADGGYDYTSALAPSDRIAQSVPRSSVLSVPSRETISLEEARAGYGYDTAVNTEREDDGYEESAATEEQPELKPSDRTRERIRQMSYYMRYETEGMRGMWEWTQMFFVKRPLLRTLFIAQWMIRK